MKKDKVTFVYNGRVEVDELGNFYGNELNDVLVERYRQLGREVVFLVRTRKILSVKTANYSAFTSHNFKVVPLPEFNNPIKFIKVYYHLRRAISKAIKDTDILVARLPSTTGRIAIEMAKKFKVPYLVEVVGCPWDALWNHSFLGKLFAPYAYLRMISLVKNAPYVQYVTTIFLQNRYPTQGVNVGISDVIIPELDTQILEKRLLRINSRDYKNSSLMLATIAGVDVEYKGQMLVLHAMAKLKSEGIRFKYFLLGKGQGQKLMNLAFQLGIIDDVVFLGEMPHFKVLEFLDDIDVYVQPSFQEGLPRSVIEALSRGCPVIGSNAGGIPELISKEVIFSKGDVDGLVTIMKSLDIQRLKGLAKENFKRAREYDFDLLTSRRNMFYREFLKAIPA